MRLHLIFVRFLSWLGISKGVYYIGRTDTLPPPLSEEEEEALLANLDEDRRYRGILVERNLRLVVYIAKKFENTGIGMDDLISIGTIGLMKAANTFRPDKNIKLATYASRCIENEILMYIRKSSHMRSELSIDEPLSTDYDGNELLLSDVLGTDDDVATRNLEETEEKSENQIFLNGFICKAPIYRKTPFGREISDILDCTRPHILMFAPTSRFAINLAFLPQAMQGI